jgi:hypothetical protein
MSPLLRGTGAEKAVGAVRVAADTVDAAEKRASALARAAAAAARMPATDNAAADEGTGVHTSGATTAGPAARTDAVDPELYEGAGVAETAAPVEASAAAVEAAIVRRAAATVSLSWRCASARAAPAAECDGVAATDHEPTLDADADWYCDGAGAGDGPETVA